MPEVGELRRDKNSYKFIWHACIGCGKERWVQIKRGKPRNPRCKSCATMERHGRGGRISDGNGYINIYVRPDDFFYPMVDKKGYVKEHRLVMARYLSRCLLPWEIVHHKNAIKDDNRIENLQLLSDSKYHMIDSLFRESWDRLKRENLLLQKRVRELECLTRRN